METAKIRQQLHQYIDEAADKQIEAIYTLLEARVEAVQARTTIDQYNDEINESEREYENGKSISQSDVAKEIKKW